MRGVVAAGLTGLLCCGCAQEPDPASAWPAAGASWVLEPRELGLGQTAWLERVVVTPPGHVPHPFVAPADPPGVWILDIEALLAEASATRWIHRTRILLRARAVGEFTWPERTLDVAGPDGGAEPLVLPALALRVASSQLAPGYSSPPCATDPTQWWGRRFLSPLIPTRFLSARVTPVFLWVLSFGRFTSRSARSAVSESR